MIHTRMGVERHLARYTGRPAETFDVVGDPLITGVWAARDSQGNQYVVYANDTIEEVTFDTWPPRSTI